MRVPKSTYRLQLSRDFTLYDAARQLPYLADLGVDWVYLSPILQAAAGSSHGYDVVDHDRIDKSRGGADGLSKFSAEARRHGLGILVDIVPNHMGIANPAENRAWWDVLRHGRESAYADWFDIDWDAAARVRIPIVGEHDVLPGGEIANLSVTAGELRYHDHRFPLAPGTEDEVDPQAAHSRQNYELVDWRRADRELTYRRFFGINSLAGLRVEDPRVFAATHREIARWFAEGLVDGVRVDHPDGLRDPADYLTRLRELTGGAYVVVEKILEPAESLPRWDCAGTTGYDSLGMIDRVLVDPAGERPLTDLADHLAGAPVDWSELIHSTKRAIADGTLAAEVERLAREMPVVETPRHRVVDALAELLASFGVYRTYLPVGSEHLDGAVGAAKRRRADLSAAIDEIAETLADPQQPAAARFQQTSGMVMAKGVEDTAFYRFSRLSSLNEVGGDPSVFCMSAAEFHTAMAHRLSDWPHTMNALTTHDTKRGEDTRARINAISEHAADWARLVATLSPLAPGRDRSLGNLVNQAIIGAWPAGAERLGAYAIKAAREAATITTWTDNDERYERAIQRYIDALTSPVPMVAINEIVQLLESSRYANALGAKLLNLMIPGVPDVYQGTECVHMSLVDPDNRRPIDWESLHELRRRAEHPLRGGEDLDVAKVRLVGEALRLRRDRPELISTYQPLEAVGDAAEHLLAFDRGGVIVVITRFPARLVANGGWGNTRLTLPGGRWSDALTAVRRPGGICEIGDILAKLPVALLVRTSDA
ncbi:malto-oligosyltrehalose synthase [Cumulibacter soli]|uniref:malto-oligosyltrehalose synthase n=1 Tax=Cumulibacter soli TaxID=2546344 RepID=UPI001067CD3E|nr:malto-oligosyltrehalose synthase [Cumulibacter soli]